MPTPAPTSSRPPRGRSPSAPSLIDRCLAGDAAAWEQLYLDIQPKLVVAVRGILGPQATDHNLVEEIIARIWFNLIDRRYRSLKRFDQNRGVRISTYLTVLARYEWLQYCRSERRRVRREQKFALDGRKESDSGQSALANRYEDFRATLTPREQDYWDHLVGDRPDRTALSASNGWKLRERIRKKLQRLVVEVAAK